MKVQLNHPGAQKSYSNRNKGYFVYDGINYRKCNHENTHYRKFMVSKAKFVNHLDDQVTQEAELFFWGEWEGCSEFKPFYNSENKLMPNGLHRPIQSSCMNSDYQNTDPYVFGDSFKYAICKQNKTLSNMNQGSLVIFGSTYPRENIFVVDTVFVVKDSEKATEIVLNKAKNYSEIYKQATINRLYQYTELNSALNISLYRGQTWYDNSEYFSFVPCKKACGEKGFSRLSLKFSDFPELNLSTNTTGVSYLKKCWLTPKEVWKKVHDEAIKQNFKLGFWFEEPLIKDINCTNDCQICDFINEGCNNKKEKIQKMTIKKKCK